MNFEEAKRELIQQWGILGSSWGINKTEAQIHALLMVSPKSLTTDDIMKELAISRGNVSMSLRSLTDWGIVFKEFKPNDRKEYFKSEKDVWTLATQIAEERRRRELMPVIKTLEKIGKMEKTKKENEEVKEFKKVTADLLKFANQSNKVLKSFVGAESNWFFNTLKKLF